MDKNQQKVMCCYCGLSLPWDNAVEITIKQNKQEEETQTVYAHPSCIDKVLHKSVPRSIDSINKP